MTAEQNPPEPSAPEQEPSVPHPRATGGSAHGRQTFPRRVRDLVRASVRAGYYVDEPLMEDRLVAQLDASRSSVRAALQQLADEGFLSRHRGRGTTVLRRGLKVRLRDVTSLSDAAGRSQAGGGSGASGAAEAAWENDDRVDIVLTEQRTVPSTPLLRERLGVDDAVVRMNENTFVVADEVIGVRTAYFSTRYGVTTWQGSGDLEEVFAQVFDAQVGLVRTEVGCAVADERTCSLFGVPAGSMVLVREQTMFDAAGTPVQVVFDNYRADRVSFVDDSEPWGSEDVAPRA